MQMKIPIEVAKSTYIIATTEIHILHLPGSIENAQRLLNFNRIERVKLALLSIDLNFGFRDNFHL
jgi:hypothetical protein